MHYRTPFRTVRRRLSMTRNGHQVGDLMRHGGGDEVVAMVVGESQVEAQHGCAATLPDTLSGHHAAQVETNLGYRYGCTVLSTQGCAKRQTVLDAGDDVRTQIGWCICSWCKGHRRNRHITDNPPATAIASMAIRSIGNQLQVLHARGL